MTTDKIREQIERIMTLSSLQKDLLKNMDEEDKKELEIIKAKLALSREEMLKSTYLIGKILKDIEEKV